MKKIVQISGVLYGSVGKIALGIAEVCEKERMQSVVYAPRTRANSGVKSPYVRLFGTLWERKLHTLLARLTGWDGFFSVFATASLIARLKREKPDVIHLHNLHGWYIHIPLLFRYLKKSGVPVVWTLHDCWAFTGHCPHFTAVGCEKWKTGCYACPSLRDYPESLCESTRFLWRRKKKLFTSVPRMTLVVPSVWLADLVKQSFLRAYPVLVIHNGIDLSVFKPTPSDFRTRYGIGEKKRIVLGVSFSWGYRKGLDVFASLYERLPAEDFQIVLVGVDENTQKTLPAGILCIRRTADARELAALYTAADVLVNPTREEVLGMVNIEANACGTPVLTFCTGGSPECIDTKSGAVVDCDDVEAMEKNIIRICDLQPFSEADCLARAGYFDKNEKNKEYIALYKDMVP